jgi:hypothetical protein
MAIVAARVHHAGLLGGKRQARLFLNGKRVDVGTEKYGSSGFGTPKDGHDAGLGITPQFDSIEFGELVYKVCGCVVLFKRELWILVEVTPPLHALSHNLLYFFAYHKFHQSPTRINIAW